MDKTASIMELVASYDRFVQAEELQATAAGDAPATTLPCESYASGYLVSKGVVGTFREVC